MRETLSQTDGNEIYEEISIRLGQFVDSYTPSGWKEPLSSVMPRFFFVGEEVKKMEHSFRQGNLRRDLEQKYKNVHVVNAILFFFENSFRH